jgi:hypothetical protein
MSAGGWLGGPALPCYTPRPVDAFNVWLCSVLAGTGAGLAAFLLAHVFPVSADVQMGTALIAGALAGLTVVLFAPLEGWW